MRAYELMVIVDPDVEDQTIGGIIDGAARQIEQAGGRVANLDRWGRRRLAYEINHKSEGYYAVFEIVAEPSALEGVDRSFHLADEVIRHKIIRLPDHEALRRGLLGGAAVPAAGAESE